MSRSYSRIFHLILILVAIREKRLSLNNTTCWPCLSQTEMIHFTGIYSIHSCTKQTWLIIYDCLTMSKFFINDTSRRNKRTNVQLHVHMLRESSSQTVHSNRTILHKRRYEVMMSTGYPLTSRIRHPITSEPRMHAPQT